MIYNLKTSRTVCTAVPSLHHSPNIKENPGTQQQWHFSFLLLFDWQEATNKLKILNKRTPAGLQCNWKYWQGLLPIAGSQEPFCACTCVLGYGIATYPLLGHLNKIYRNNLNKAINAKKLTHFTCLLLHWNHCVYTEHLLCLLCALKTTDRHAICEKHGLSEEQRGLEKLRSS